MKKLLLTSLFLLISLTFFAQGIAVQGIARDNAKSALENKTITFTFSIFNNGGDQVFTEQESIKTDGFGVFAHIVGNVKKSDFDKIDFSVQDLRIKVTINYESKSIEVYNQPFQYTPYAHFAKRAALATNATNADNGVPTGAIMPFLGETAPAGWVMCLGQDISTVPGSEALRTLLNDNKAPKLQGMFLRGAGTSTFSSVVTTLKGQQNHAFQIHDHPNDIKVIPKQGTHQHSVPFAKGLGQGGDLGTASGGGIDWQITVAGQGGHEHNLTGSVNNRGITDNTTNAHATETRPVNYGVNYIIKL